MSDSIRVIFEPDGKSIFVMRGSSIVEAAGEAGIILTMPCGGGGTCGKCKVEMSKGAPEPCDADREHLSVEEISQGWRLACQATLQDEAIIRVPAEIRYFEKKSLTQQAYRETALHPNISKLYLQMAEPSLDDQRADADRLLEAASSSDNGMAWAELDIIRQLPNHLREDEFAVTAVLEGSEIVAVERGDTVDLNYGVAFDIGTTTVVGMLIDLNTGEERAASCRTNPQVMYGDDVVARISYTQENEGGLVNLQNRMVGCINEIIEELCRTAGVEETHIYEATVVGNTTMNHLLLGIDPQYIARAPYTAVLRSGIDTKAARLGIQINANGNLHTMPNIAGFVGGDTVGVVLATNMMAGEKPTLAIDIGTNGELVIGTKERMLTCSTAAGPALEGARIRHGMRAAEGAIDKIKFNEDVEINVIGDVSPKGICGTALLDAVAELLRVGIVDMTGRIVAPGDLPDTLSEQLRQRVVEGAQGYDFLVVGGSETENGQAILLTQRDIREVQLAKGAISAGTEILMKELGVTIDDIDAVLLAGAFGNFIRRSSALRIGLLPSVPKERIRFVGNAAGAGARMVLATRECREEAHRISRFVEYVELAGRSDFQQEFSTAMLFM